MVTLLLLLGCAEVDGVAALPVPWSPTPQVQTAGGTPGHALDVAVTGAPGAPGGARVWLAIGSGLGPGPCPPALNGACFDVRGARPHGSAVASAQGVARFTIHVPRGAPVGAVRGLQAVVEGVGKTAAVEIEVADPVDVCDPADLGGPVGSGVLACDVLALINDARAVGADCGRRGVFGPTHPLTMDDLLRDAAIVHADWMATNGQLTHRSPGGPLGESPGQRANNAGYRPWAALAETLHRGSATATGAVTSWLASPEHCANLMDPDVRDLGVGVAQAAGGQVYWAAMMGELRGAGN